MSTADAGTRSYYLDDFADEVLPCDTSLEAWAQWLASVPVADEDGQTEFGREAPASDGAVFAGSAILWHEDIVATRTDGTWSLSRAPGDDDFIAVRFCEGSGWSAENIVNADFEQVGDTWAPSETMEQALLRFLTEEGDCCDDTEHVAVGTHEEGYRFTFRAGPPPQLEAERTQ